MNYRNDRKARESDRKPQKTTENKVNGGKSDRKIEKAGDSYMKKYGEQISGKRIVFINWPIRSGPHKAPVLS